MQYKLSGRNSVFKEDEKEHVILNKRLITAFYQYLKPEVHLNNV
jgi:hypothetical protein